MSVSPIRKSKTNEATHIKSSCDMIVLKPIIYFYSNPTRTRGNTMFIYIQKKQMIFCITGRKSEMQHASNISHIAKIMKLIIVIR